MRLVDFGMPDEVLDAAKRCGVTMKNLKSFERSILTGTQSGYAYAFVIVFEKNEDWYNLVILPDGKVKLYEPYDGVITLNLVVGEEDDE